MSEMPELIVEVTQSSLEYSRERIAELEAEVARLKAEIDNMQADHHTIHVRSSALQMAMEVCKDEDTGTVLRETDGQRRDYVLGEDRSWRAR